MRADYDHFVLMLKSHSWKKIKIGEKSAIKNKIIEGIIVKHIIFYIFHIL